MGPGYAEALRLAVWLRQMPAVVVATEEKQWWLQQCLGFADVAPFFRMQALAGGSCCSTAAVTCCAFT
jgi:hypothetical protein